jgi:hypothetical protein
MIPETRVGIMITCPAKRSIIWPRPKDGSIICPTENTLSTKDENEARLAFLHSLLDALIQRAHDAEAYAP